MAWGGEQQESPPLDSREVGRYVRAAGIDRALDRLSGPFGCRRFVVRFHAVGQGVRVHSVEAVPLSWGGGPPPQDPSGEAGRRLERALTSLFKNMTTGGHPWTRGAVAYLRDAQGGTQLLPLFGADADLIKLEELGVPGPPGHPLESTDYLDTLAMWEGRMGQVHARSHAISYDWDWWEIESDRTLWLVYEGPPEQRRRHRCLVLATFEPRHGRFTWRTDTPPFDDDVYKLEYFAATLEAAVELGMMTTARLGGQWLFVQSYDDHDSKLIVAVFE